MSEKRAYAKFKRIVWDANGGRPICPDCGGLDHWVLICDQKWKCRGCRKQFSVTSGTIFRSHKLSFRKMLGACAIFVNGVMGVAACRLSRDLGVSYKCAWVLLHKAREAMGLDAEASQLGGVVEIDGAVFGRNFPKLPNTKKLWQKFKLKHKSAARKRKQLIVVMRERDDLENGIIGKVRTFLLGKEGDAIEVARGMVLPDAIIHADMSPQWEPLHMLFKTKRINHSLHYSHDGACTNMAESFFSRMRCAERGVHKHISGAHLHRYAMELGWREQYRRRPNGEQFSLIVSAIGRAPPSKSMTGYWQRRSANDNLTSSVSDQPGSEVTDYLTGRKG